LFAYCYKSVWDSNSFKIKGYAEYPEDTSRNYMNNFDRIIGNIGTDRPVHFLRGTTPGELFDLFDEEIRSVLAVGTTCGVGINGFILVQAAYSRQWTKDEFTLLETLGEQVS
jgi:hypothetical protein